MARSCVWLVRLIGYGRSVRTVYRLGSANKYLYVASLCSAIGHIDHLCDVHPLRLATNEFHNGNFALKCEFFVTECIHQQALEAGQSPMSRQFKHLMN